MASWRNLFLERIEGFTSITGVPSLSTVLFPASYLVFSLYTTFLPNKVSTSVRSIAAFLRKQVSPKILLHLFCFTEPSCEVSKGVINKATIITKDLYIFYKGSPLGTDFICGQPDLQGLLELLN